jgi:hypothetical protein
VHLNNATQQQPVPEHTPELTREVTLSASLLPCVLAAAASAAAAMSPEDTGSSAPYTSSGSCLVRASLSLRTLEGCTQYLVVLRVNCRGVLQVEQQQ